MPEHVLDLEDLEDFFEEGFNVVSRSATEWLFEATSDEFADQTVKFEGSGLSGDGDFPDGGTINHVIISGPEGVIADIADLDLAAATLAEELDFDDEEGEDHDTDEDDDDDGDHVVGGGDDDDLDGHDGDDDLSGSDGDDDLSGHGGDDDLSGDDGDDELSGKGGDDLLNGDDGDDDLRGAGGDDEIHGGDGDDNVVGSGGRDDLFGDEGNDHLRGQGGGDRLDGGDDDDVLIGGGGKDVYVFSLNFGDDVIKRFDAGKDKIDLSALGITDFKNEVTIAKDDGDTVVTTAEGTITIDKIAGGNIVDEDDFLF